MQSVIKTNTEYGLLYPVLEQNGFDSVLLKPKFVFNPPDPFTELGMSDLNTAFQLTAITKADFVRNARKIGKLDLDDPIEPVMQPGLPMAAPANTANPGDLITNPAPKGNPLNIDPNAYQNLMQVQADFENIAKDLKRRLEDLAAGAQGAASAVSAPKKRKKV